MVVKTLRTKLKIQISIILTKKTYGDRLNEYFHKWFIHVLLPKLIPIILLIILLLFLIK